MFWWVRVILAIVIGVPIAIAVVGLVCFGLAWLMVLFTENLERKHDANKPLNWFEKVIEKLFNFILKE